MKNIKNSKDHLGTLLFQQIPQPNSLPVLNNLKNITHLNNIHKICLKCKKEKANVNLR